MSEAGPLPTSATRPRSWAAAAARACLAVVIGGEPLQGSDRHRLELLPQQAGPLAVKLMLADTAADTREWAFLADLVESPRKVALRHQADECLNINVQWACFNASRIFALQTPKSLDLDVLERKTQRDFLGRTDALVRGKKSTGTD